MKLVVASTLVFHLNFLKQINAHGAQSFPPSRQWLCSSQNGAIPNLGVQWGGGNGPNICKEDWHTQNMNTVMVDWSSIGIMGARAWSTTEKYQQDPRLPHIEVMNSMDNSNVQSGNLGQATGNPLDARPCSSNNNRWAALDNPKWHTNQGGFPANFEFQEYPTKMKNGPTEFMYTCSAPHRTTGKGYFDSYITKDGVDFTKELTWNDFQERPFCSWMPPSYPSATQQSGQPSASEKFINSDKYDCDIPTDKLGAHTILTIWQRDDTGESFYSCSDVELEAFDGSSASQSNNDGNDQEGNIDQSMPVDPVDEPNLPEIPSVEVGTDDGYDENPNNENGYDETDMTENNCQPLQKKPTLIHTGLIHQLNKPEYCLDHNNGGKFVYMKYCTASRRQWTLEDNYTIKEQKANKCLAVNTKKPKFPTTKVETAVVLQNCSAFKLQQKFFYRNGRIYSFMDDRYCLKVADQMTGKVVMSPCFGIDAEEQDQMNQFGFVF